MTIHLVQVTMNIVNCCIYVHFQVDLSLSSESLLTCFKIIDNYCMLGGADFLQVSIIHMIVKGKS